MASRYPAMAGDRPVERVSTGREPDCPICNGPFAAGGGQRMILPPGQWSWTHLGCYALEQRRKAERLGTR